MQLCEWSVPEWLRELRQWKEVHDRDVNESLSIVDDRQNSGQIVRAATG